MSNIHTTNERFKKSKQNSIQNKNKQRLKSNVAMKKMSFSNTVNVVFFLTHAQEKKTTIQKNLQRKRRKINKKKINS